MKKSKAVEISEKVNQNTKDLLLNLQANPEGLEEWDGRQARQAKNLVLATEKKGKLVMTALGKKVQDALDAGSGNF